MNQRIEQCFEKRSVYRDWHRLGLVTGLSPESSKEYYTKLCAMARADLGGDNCPLLSTENVNFGEITALMELGEWDEIESRLIGAMLRLQLSGVEAIALCSNTIHRALSKRTAKVIKAPIIHIGDCVAQGILMYKLDRVGFLGTKFSMMEDFMINRLRESHAQIYLPTLEQADRIDAIIFDELCKGIFRDESRQFLLSVIDGMIKEDRIQGVVLGCTELPLLITAEVQTRFDERYSIEHGESFCFLDSEELHLDALLDFCINGRIS